MRQDARRGVAGRPPNLGPVKSMKKRPRVHFAGLQYYCMRGRGGGEREGGGEGGGDEREGAERET